MHKYAIAPRIVDFLMFKYGLDFLLCSFSVGAIFVASVARIVFDQEGLGLILRASMSK